MIDPITLYTIDQTYVQYTINLSYSTDRYYVYDGRYGNFARIG